MSQARRALDDMEYAEVLQKVETVRVLNPGQAGLEELEGEAYFGMGQKLEKMDDLSGAAIAYQRCLASLPGHSQAADNLARVSSLSNQLAARSDAIRDQFTSALQAYAQGDFQQAKNGFTKVLELNPDDQEAAALLKSTLQTLELRASSLIDQAKAQALAGNFVEAYSILEQVDEMSPGHASLPAAETFVAEKERQMAAARKAALLASQQQVETPSAMVVPAPAVIVPSFGSLSAKDQQEVADLYTRGMQAVENDRHEDAIRYWELVWSKAPDYQQVSENLKQEYLDKGMEAFADGRLAQSIEIWEKARTVAPDDARTQGYLARAYEHSSRIQEIKGDH